MLNNDQFLRKFSIYSIFVLAYNILVVLWGAYVRATGSGAGCGSHWPLCNGVIIPRAPQIATIVELFHRLTSGAALIFVMVLFIIGFRKFHKGDPIRTGVSYSFLFIITESLVGAGLVIFGWVDEDQSTARMVIQAIHLLNTFLLLASLSYTYWWTRNRDRTHTQIRSILKIALLFGYFGIILIGITGAITALGDTLFPATSLSEGIQQDFSTDSHIAVKLRVWHPLFAIFLGTYLILLSRILTKLHSESYLVKLSFTFSALFIFQGVAGIINVILLAPVWMQIVHLLLADLVWISYVFLVCQVNTKQEKIGNISEPLTT